MPIILHYYFLFIIFLRIIHFKRNWQFDAKAAHDEFEQWKHDVDASTVVINKEKWISNFSKVVTVISLAPLAYTLFLPLAFWIKSLTILNIGFYLLNGLRAESIGNTGKAIAFNKIWWLLDQSVDLSNLAILSVVLTAI